jgi:hypothetical protein
MISCRQARRIMVDRVREQSGEADRLLLEDHLATCQTCREERGRWALLEKLRDGPTPSLTSDARVRVLARLLRSPVSPTAPAPRMRPVRPALTLAVAVATAVMAFVWGPRVWKAVGRAPQVQVSQARPPAGSQPTPNLAETPALFHADTAGATNLPGVHIGYAAGTTLRTSGNQREVHLFEGEIDVDVTPGGPGDFRVVAPRFVVVVLGTRFVVRTDSVRTLRGRVRVESPSGEILAVLGVGDVWTLPPPALGASVPERASALPPATAAKHRPPRPASKQLPSIPKPEPNGAPTQIGTCDGLLREARSLLVGGDTARARDRIAAALAGKPTQRERARAELLSADALLVERQRAQAMEAYRKVDERFADLPEGDSAGFIAAQLAGERGTRNEARTAFEGYLARHPTGRFAREARDKLAALARP